MLAGMLLVVDCNSSKTRRVSVAHPEHWPVGEYRNCGRLGPPAPVSGFPLLDCDLEARETPRSRILVMDVVFSGDPRKDSPWTCQKSKESLVCRN
jgi:hypothetical protein